MSQFSEYSVLIFGKNIPENRTLNIIYINIII
nr:MAG TPA: hypothetical protein [Caudoviricetes sp.]